MTKSECKRIRIGREYLRNVQWPDILRTPARDRCYCKRCYSSTKPDTLPVAGYTYVIPRGWTRFAVSVDDSFAKHHDVWDKWLNCYHGTSIENAKSAVEHRQLLLPSDVTLGGKKLAIREGHISGEQYVFTTPSISYAALPCYAYTYNYPSALDLPLYKIKVALQCKQKPDSMIVQPETVGAREQRMRICSHFTNEELEWKTQYRAAVMIYGLLLEIKGVEDDDDDPDAVQDRSTIPTKSITSERTPFRGEPKPPSWLTSKIEVISSSLTTYILTEYVKKRFGMAKRNIEILIVLIVLTSLLFTALIIGRMYRAECPIQSWIPQWLVIFGAVGLVTFGLIFVTDLITFKCCSDGSGSSDYFNIKFILCLSIFFFIAWLITGSIWVFPHKTIVQFSEPSASNYCRKTPYMFAFGLLLTQYALIGLAIFIYWLVSAIAKQHTPTTVG